MGLDVYLYKTANGKTAKDLEEEARRYNEAHDAWWEDCPPYPDSGSEKERDAWSKAVDEWKAAKEAAGDPEPVDPEEESCEHIEIPSEIDPEHLFKIGYFRSSYNGGGINRVLGDAGLPTLYEIFFEDGQDDSYLVQPDWRAALDRCKDTIAQFDTEREDGRLSYRAIEMNAGILPDWAKTPKNETDALEIFLDEKEKNGERKMPFGNNYSSGQGTFLFDDPMEVLAYMPGESKYGFSGKNCVYAIVRQSMDGLDHYRTSLAIVQETIEYVLNSGEPENFYFHWSG